MNHIHREQLEDDGTSWKYRSILGHQGPLTHRDRHYKGSKYNVEIEWENGEITFEPINLIKEDDPVTLAAYAKEHNLLETDGWKSLNRYAKREKKLKRLVNQAKLRSFRTAPKYQYGFQVPVDYEDAIQLDKQNRNNRWEIAITLEMTQLNDYQTFIDMGKYKPGCIPPGFKKINVHLMFAVKHDGRHKA